jgi:hypothetical protein
MNNNWFFNWSSYTTYCPDCSPNEEIAIVESQSRTMTVSQKEAKMEEKNCKMEEEQNE